MGATPSARRFSRWHLPSMPRVRIPARRERAATIVTSPASATVSPAARRRRILTVLALATLLTAAVVGVAALANLPVPTWLVAVPGGLMAGYLALLAIVRPGAPRRGTTDSLPALPVSDTDTDTDTDTDAGTGTDTHADMVGAEVAAAVDEPTVTVAEPPVTVEPQVEDDTWTPVPLPSPTYVTAPRARRSVRSIDLSNPGSWTSSAAPAPAAATLAPSESDENQEHLVEHRRAVGG